LKIVVLIPTYNESENIVRLLEEIDGLGLENLEVLVVDDASPDGTADLVARFGRIHANVSVLRRESDRGRGRAGREGFLEALNRGADRIVEMDADFSHHPRYLPRLIDAAADTDVVLGSRFVSGGQDADRTWVRKVITVLANVYIRIMFGVPIRDCNSGYRCFRRDALIAIDPASIRSAGPAIIQEVLFKAHRARLSIKEVPVVFTDRVDGTSKLGYRQLTQGYTTVLSLWWRSLFGGLD
jgi:dolichol-phosphate mannosyltransferase